MPTLLRAAKVNLLLAPTGAVLAFLAYALIARWLGPETYADYATLLALLSWLLLFAESGCNVGIGRFLKEASMLVARGRLYRVLQYRRWTLAMLLAGALIWLGPVWAEHMGLGKDVWWPASFFMVGLLAAIMLHGQLAASTLMATYRHGQVLLISQMMTISRALVLVTLAGVWRDPALLVTALIILAALEAWLLHHATVTLIGQERKALKRGMANAAQRHGLIALFDKLTTALSAGPFLLLVLAGVHDRAELAMLAIATELIQKALSVIGLPLSNLVLPVLNDSRQDPERFRLQLTRLGGLSVIWFTLTAGAILVFLPTGLPLLLGPSYAAAVTIATLWLLPVFVESAVRMIWGAALITQGQYRWVIRVNLVYAGVSLLVIYLAHSASLHVLLVCLGVVRLVMAALVLHRSSQLRYLTADAFPLRFIAAAAAACLLALVVQTLPEATHPAWALTAGLLTYFGVVLVSVYFFPLIPHSSYDALRKLAGRHEGVVTKLILTIPIHQNRVG